MHIIYLYHLHLHPSSLPTQYIQFCILLSSHYFQFSIPSVLLVKPVFTHFPSTMKRSAKILWVGTVFTTIIIAAVAGFVVYFTAFRNDPNSSQTPAGAPASENDTSSSQTTPPPHSTSSPISTSSLSAPSPTAISPSPSDPSASSTTPPPTTQKFDHLSHAVPGYTYTAVDYDGDGTEQIQLDGSRSHTHYIHEGPPIRNGKLVSMRWFNEKNKTLSTVAMPKVTFSIGKSIVGLTVVDDSGDSHTDYATVTIERPTFDGTYCYYYPPSSDSQLTLTDDITEEPLPIFAAAASNLSFSSTSQWPSTIRSRPFQVRCTFVLPKGQFQASVTAGGPFSLLINNRSVIQSTSTSKRTIENPINLGETHNVVYLLYAHSSSRTPILQFQYDGPTIQYDASAILPVLLSIEPFTSLLEGGGSAKITGIALQNDLKIDFGGTQLSVDSDPSTSNSVFVTIPPSQAEKQIQVRAINNAGASNSLNFEYLTDALPPIKFTQSRLTKKQGGPFDINLITGIKYGPDHRYYLSSLNSLVHSFAADSNMNVLDLCTSSSLGDNRAILGLAFNPADTQFRLYVSASVLEWHAKNRLKGPWAWANGEVLLIQKDVDGSCLGQVGDPVISGLPVSDHDHGVNALVFDNDGKLHFQVGGFTNAGVKDQTKLGGLDANPLSGASLVADINKVAFNGNIEYDSSKPAEAKKIKGDVDVYMSGLRNSFGINIHSNGHLYATENGASVGFGDRSTSCSTSQPFVTGENLADEFIMIIEGKYAGHPNRNRGRFDKRECVFRGPEEKSDDFYEGPIATFESSTDGIIEYTANTFGGQMKGDILCSKFETQESDGKVFRIQLNEDGRLLSGPDEIWPASGLSIEMSPFGHLLMPRIFEGEILVLSPKRRNGSLLPTFIAVLPFRGPLAGGNEVIVTGEDLKDGAVATFGGTACTNATDVSADRRWFKCRVPPGTGNDNRAVSVGLQFDDSKYDVAEGEGIDYVYMNV